MTWAKIDDRLHSHPKARRAGMEAMGLWALALSFCGAYNTDGRIGRADIEAIAGKRAAALADRLVLAGLWTAVEGGWAFHDFLAYNPSAAAVEAERARKSEAGRRGGLASGASRSKNEAGASPPAEAQAEAGASRLLPEPAELPIPIPSRPDPVPNPEIPPNPPPGGTGKSEAFKLESQPANPRPTRPREPKPQKPPGAEQRYRAAYLRGIERGAPGTDYALPPGKLCAIIGPALAVHAKRDGVPLVGDDLDGWIEDRVADFRRTTDGTYTGNWSPFAFAKSLNGDPRAAPRPDPVARTSAQPAGSFVPTGRSLALHRPGDPPP